MVTTQLEARGISDPRVLEAFRKVPRHLFVPPELESRAYDDCALGIGEGQTISQPYIVAYMTEALGAGPEARVLEIGTGSGYQAAILAELVEEVYTVEVREPLARRAEELLRRLGYENVHVKCADGSKGWPEAAPFDGIVVTAASERVPEALLEQLAAGARLVIPLGREFQRLHVFVKGERGVEEEMHFAVRFVPFVWPDSGEVD